MIFFFFFVSGLLSLNATIIYILFFPQNSSPVPVPVWVVTACTSNQNEDLNACFPEWPPVEKIIDRNIHWILNESVVVSLLGLQISDRAGSLCMLEATHLSEAAVARCQESFPIGQRPAVWKWLSALLCPQEANWKAPFLKNSVESKIFTQGEQECFQRTPRPLFTYSSIFRHTYCLHFVTSVNMTVH